MACANEELPYLGLKGAMADDIHVLSIEDVNQHSSSRHGSGYGCAYSGVRIREFDGGNVNPEPERRNEEDAESLWEDFLSPNKLKTISGVNNLDSVTFLEMQVNTNEHSLGNFGGMLPNLSQLKLSNSVISTVRDLGTSLPNLKTLWLSRCGLTDLDGISSIPFLMELYVAFNDISDVSPVSMLDNLEVLDLEGNLIDDLSQVEFLTLCSTLKSLNLEGNPVCVAPHPDSTVQEMAGYEYRQAIHHAVPGLKILDDEPFLVEKVDGKNVLRDMPDSAKCTKVPNHLKDEWQLINDGLKAVEGEQEEDESVQSSPAPRAASAWSSTRPKTAMSRPRPSSASRQRPGSAIGQRPGSAIGQRPGSAIGQRPGSAIGQRPGSSLGSSGSQSDLSGIFQGDDSSDLTHGCSEVICGNISKALKSRRKNIQNVKLAIVPFSNNLHTPEKSYEEEAGDSPSKDDVLEELKQWRQQFAKFVDEDHSLPTSIDTESSQSDSESPSSSPRRTEAFESSPSPPHCRTSLTPSPPPPSIQRSRPSPMRRSLPIAPLVGRDLQRPHTSGEFRIRRYRQASTEKNIDNLRALKQENDVDVNQNELTSSLESRIPPSSLAVLESEPRSSSAPVRATTRYRVLPSTPPDTRTNSQPTDECSLPAGQSPISSVSHGYRPGTAAAALQKRRLKPSRKS